MPLVTTRGQECTLCSVAAQAAQSLDLPIGLVSIPPGCFWLVAGLIFIFSVFICLLPW